MARIEITKSDDGFVMETSGNPIELMGMAEYVKMSIELIYVEMIRKKSITAKKHLLSGETDGEKT